MTEAIRTALEALTLSEEQIADCFDKAAISYQRHRFSGPRRGR